MESTAPESLSTVVYELASMLGRGHISRLEDVVIVGPVFFNGQAKKWKLMSDGLWVFLKLRQSHRHQRQTTGTLLS